MRHEDNSGNARNQTRDRWVGSEKAFYSTIRLPSELSTLFPGSNENSADFLIVRISGGDLIKF